MGAEGPNNGETNGPGFGPGLVSHQKKEKKTWDASHLRISELVSDVPRCQVEELGRGRTMEKLTTFLVASGHGPQFLQIFFGGSLQWLQQSLLTNPNAYAWIHTSKDCPAPDMVIART